VRQLILIGTTQVDQAGWRVSSTPHHLADGRAENPHQPGGPGGGERRALAPAPWRRHVEAGPRWTCIGSIPGWPARLEQDWRTPIEQRKPGLLARYGDFDTRSERLLFDSGEAGCAPCGSEGKAVAAGFRAPSRVN